MDAARTEPEPEPEQENDRLAVAMKLIAELTADNQTLRAEKAEREAPPPIKWLSIKGAAYRAGIGDEQMRRWAANGRVISRREGRPIFVDEASVDVYLARLGRKPVITFR
jgi:hypothetical protein